MRKYAPIRFIRNYLALIIPGILAMSAILLCSATCRGDESRLFTKITNYGGDHHIRSIIELPDGRIAFNTIDGKLTGSVKEYPESEEWKFSETSLIVLQNNRVLLTNSNLKQNPGY